MGGVPDGEPRTVFKTQGSVQQVHAYGGVCKHGLTELTIMERLHLAYAARVPRFAPQSMEGCLQR